MQQAGDLGADPLRGTGHQRRLSREVDRDAHSNIEPFFSDPVGQDLLAAGAAAVLDHREGPAQPAVVARAAHQDDRVGVGEDVPLADRLRQQLVEHDLRRGVEIQAADVPVVVAMGEHLGLEGPVFLPQPLARGPFVLLAQDVVVDVLEEVELDRVAEPLGRLQAVEDDAAATAGEVLIEETHGAAEDPRQVRFPLVPLLVLDVPARDSTPAAIDRVEVVADRPVEVPGMAEVGGHRERVLVQVPVEKPRRVLGVILRVAATGQVAEDPSLPLAGQSRLRPAQADLRLADARRPGHDRQCARKQSTSQCTIQFLQSKRMSSNGHSSLARSTAAGGRIRKSQLSPLCGPRSRRDKSGRRHFAARDEVAPPANAELYLRTRTIRRSRYSFLSRTGPIVARADLSPRRDWRSRRAVANARTVANVGRARTLSAARVRCFQSTDRGRLSVDTRGGMDNMRLCDRRVPNRLRLDAGLVFVAVLLGVLPIRAQTTPSDATPRASATPPVANPDLIEPIVVTGPSAALDARTRRVNSRAAGPHPAEHAQPAPARAATRGHHTAGHPAGSRPGRIGPAGRAATSAGHPGSRATRPAWSPSAHRVSDLGDRISRSPATSTT